MFNKWKFNNNKLNGKDEDLCQSKTCRETCEVSERVIKIMGKRICLSSPHMSDEGYEQQFIEVRTVINTNAVIDRGYIIDLEAIVDHDSFIGFGCHIDCGAIVKTHCVVMAHIKIESGKIVTRDDMPTPEQFLKANGF